MERQAAVYQDIAGRTDGDIYIGVVGPVRTGKSTFIKRFMEEMVLPSIKGDAKRARAVDELPVSGAGKTIMTTQPKFVPNEAVEIALPGEARVRVRLIDCVGYLVRGVMGLNEGEGARMVRTPWFEQDIPFEKAAEIGTRKVIEEHSTLGVVVTTDGSITELPRSAYVEAEERVIGELKALGKPFVIVLNSAEPTGDAAKMLKSALSEKYETPVVLMDVLSMDEAQASALMEALLFEFPLVEAYLRLPAWVSALPQDHYLVTALTQAAREAALSINKVRDHDKLRAAFGTCPYAQGAHAERIRPAEGAADYAVDLKDGLFYRILGEESGQQVNGEEHLLRLMTEMTQAKRAYDRVEAALKSASETGYGLVSPSMAELTLAQPEIIKQGGKYGVRLRATAPSLHLIRVDVGAEVSPIVGTQQQSEELIGYLLSEFESDPDSIWSTNMFGKPLSDLMRDELAGKLTRMPGEVQEKMRTAITKIINDGSGGIVCVLL
ncbi:MAG: stage IV sporulation protein A [Clostridia bacterium]